MSHLSVIWGEITLLRRANPTVGMLLGGGIGYGLPQLLHYSHPLSIQSDDGLARGGLVPVVSDSTLGLEGIGYF